MGTLLLKLAGPLQSWGADSRFTERKTRHEPTKSGVVGLLASALGRKREEPIDDLAALPIAVRIDQPGRYECDFQTAHTKKYDKKTQCWEFDKSLPLSKRYYLSDAVFVVGIEVADERLGELANALVYPTFPLFLGRRSCPPAGKVLLGVRPGAALMDAMREQPWEASDPRLIERHKHERCVRRELLRDRLFADETSQDGELVRDYPLSYSQLYRRYEWRTVVHETPEVPNPYFVEAKPVPTHDPMSVFEEA